MSKTKQSELNSSRKFPLQQITIEVLSIVLGVLLALAVNEWRSQRSQQAEAKAALVNIQNELQANLTALRLLHENNSVTVKLMQDPEKAGTEEDRKFIPGMQLQETSWQTLLSTGVSNYVEYETVLKLSQSYSMQGVYKQTGRLLAQAAMNSAGYAAVIDKEIDNNSFNRQFINYLEMIVVIEQELLKSYEQTLEHLSEHL
jgi:type II secretory pathway pseudopilin PulG